jgi:penicillin-binding protein 1A
MDAWFAGFQPTLMAVTWIGFDSPRKLGDKETGGGLSLPVWISYMEHALKDVPVSELSPTEGVVHVGGEWFYDEYAGEAGVKSLGLDELPPVADAPASAPTPVPAPAQAPAPAPAPVPTPAVIPAPPAVPVPPPSEEKKNILDLFKN